jgi:hypothetical protein
MMRKIDQKNEDIQAIYIYALIPSSGSPITNIYIGFVFVFKVVWSDG